MTSKRTRMVLLIAAMVMVCSIRISMASGFDVARKEIQRGGSEPDRPPNLMVLLLDDVDVDLLREPLLSHFPNLKNLRDRSIVFRNAFVTTPLCGPVRAAIQRGQYAHRTGVLTNVPGTAGLPTEPTGSFNVFFEQGLADDTLATRLDNAGYHTMLVGKYLHSNFPGDAGNGYIPPGWDEFYGSNGGKYYGTHRYINGVGSYIEADAYRTDVERDDALRLLGEAPADAPWLLFLAPFAVHAQEAGSGPMFASRHADFFAATEIAPAPDLLAPDEWGLYDPVSPASFDRMTNFQRDRLRSLLAVDEMVEEILELVDVRGETGKTIVVVTSDNGYLLGHRRHEGKSVPYNRALRVPLWIHSAEYAPAETDRLATLADVLPTLVDVGEGSAPDYTDGISLRPVLEDAQTTEWRTEVLAEGASWLYSNGGLRNVLDSRWTALMTETEKYVEFADGRWMFHDLSADPYEMVPSSATLSDRAPWQRRLAVLEQCAAEGCRGLEPETSISTPLATIMPPSGIVINGFASAPEGRGVTEVRVVVEHSETGRYWNGSAWQMDYVQLPAALGQPNENTSSWSFTLSTPVIPESDHVNVRARTYDNASTWDRSVASVRLTLSSGGGDYPETTMELPSRLQVGPVKIAGWVLDKSGVNRVDLLVNGVPVPTQLGPAPRYELVRTWTAEVTLVQGLNEFSATGVDDYGLADPTPATGSVYVP